MGRITRDELVAELMKYPNLPVIVKEGESGGKHLYEGAVELKTGRSCTGYESGFVRFGSGKQDFLMID